MDGEHFDSDMIRFTKFFVKHCGDQQKFASTENCTVKRSNPSLLYSYEFKKCNKILHIYSDSTSSKKISPFHRTKMHKSYYKGSNLWLLKPTSLNQGRGIEVFNTLEDLNRFINEYLEGEKSPKKKQVKPEDESGSDIDSDEEAKKETKKGPPGANFRSRTFVIQKYIESPLLVYNRKFDIRVYAMVTHDLQLYFFRYCSSRPDYGLTHTTERAISVHLLKSIHSEKTLSTTNSFT